MTSLTITGVTKRFGTQKALNNVSIDVAQGELVAILGPSGCGKTTLLRIIAGLETVDEGTITIGGADATHLPAAKRNFGIVFQSYALFPNMTVLGNILFALKQKSRAAKDDQELRALEVLRLVDLFDHRHKFPRQLSGGQQQRTALARAIAVEPAFLLLDEPLSALDAKVRHKLRAEIRAIQKQLGVTTIMVTHDQDEAMTMADRVIVMNDAVVEQVGTPREIYERPATEFVASFIGSMNFMPDDDGAATYAIRPEKIAVVTRHENWDTHAQVTDVEFKGSITRIHARRADGGDVMIDVDSEAASAMTLFAGKVIYLRMPPEHIATFTAARPQQMALAS